VHGGKVLNLETWFLLLLNECSPPDCIVLMTEWDHTVKYKIKHRVDSNPWLLSLSAVFVLALRAGERVFIRECCSCMAFSRRIASGYFKSPTLCLDTESLSASVGSDLSENNWFHFLNNFLFLLHLTEKFRGDMVSMETWRDAITRWLNAKIILRNQNDQRSRSCLSLLRLLQQNTIDWVA